jgi:hypothetical protein
MFHVDVEDASQEFGPTDAAEQKIFKLRVFIFFISDHLTLKKTGA